MFAEDDGSVHAVYGLRGGDVAFYVAERQVEEGSSPEVNTGRYGSKDQKVIIVEEGQYW